jgi:hypothetical protein
MDGRPMDALSSPRNLLELQEDKHLAELVRIGISGGAKTLKTASSLGLDRLLTILLPLLVVPSTFLRSSEDTPSVSLRHQ